jgi:RNA polymerase sigma factor (sigma-70 family)
VSGTPAPAPHAATAQAITTVWRLESARIVAGVARLVRDVGLAEELAQDALVAALEHWPQHGLPHKPGAWLMTTAQRRALDHLRQQAMHTRHHEALGADLAALQADVAPDVSELVAQAQAQDIADDLLRLIFTACHPVLSPAARTALTLKLLCGLSTDEIARAYLVSEATLAQRIVRAKRTLSAAHVPFELPPPAERGERLASVLEVIYLVFNEGYSATAGEHWVRPALCHEAQRLARTLAELTPGEPEVHGLLALLELQASRLPARCDAQGQPVLLPAQNRSHWDRLLIRRGLAALARADALWAGQQQTRGPYTLQAALAACHARALSHQATDWLQIVALYDALAAQTPSPVIALNRAVAVSMAHGPASALPLVQALLAEPSLQGYPWLHSVHADLLTQLGQHPAASLAFERAAGLTRNAADQRLLRARAQEAQSKAAFAIEMPANEPPTPQAAP